MTIEETIERGRRARSLLEDGVLGAAIFEAKRRAQGSWLESNTPEGAVAARERHLAVEEVVRILHGFVGEMEMEEHKLKLRNPR